MSIPPAKLRKHVEVGHILRNSPRSPALDTTVIDEKLVAAISQLLTGDSIPCILWGNYLLTVYGVLQL
jgi:hypothetical protein